MGPGPLTAVYQARFMRYLEYRGMLEHQGRKVWAFLGDGEMDQPESLAARARKARQRHLIDHGDPLTLLADCGLDASGIATAIRTRFQLPLPETQ